MPPRKERVPVVLDTNVVIAYYLSTNPRSTSRRIFHLWRDIRRLQLIVSREVEDEYVEVLRRVNVAENRLRRCHLRLSARKPKKPGYPDEPKTLGEHLRKRRMDLGLRQSDVARTIGVWTQTVNYWENNHFNPEPQYVPKIVAFLGYDPFGPPPPSFPLAFKAARIAAGLTRRQVAARLGVHPGTVAEWERGRGAAG